MVVVVLALAVAVRVVVAAVGAVAAAVAVTDRVAVDILAAAVVVVDDQSFFLTLSLSFFGCHVLSFFLWPFRSDGLNSPNCAFC